MEKKDYYVTIAVDGRITLKVEGVESLEEAKEEALYQFTGVDLGNLEVIDYKAVNATDENDNIFDF